MRHRSYRLVALLLTFAAAAAVGRASADPVEPSGLRFALHFGGFHVADLHFEQQRAGDSYEAGLRIRTTGLADMIARYDGHAGVQGVIADDRLLQPEQYGYRYKSRRGRRVVEVVYDPETRAAVKVRSEKRGKRDSVDVPRELWQDVLDPLSAFLMLREHIRESRTEGTPSFSVNVFDGRRRYRLDATLRGQADPSADGPGALQVDAIVHPIAGFDDEDMSAREKNEGYRIRALFSDDERLLPLDIRTLNTTAIVTIRLIGCAGDAGCATAENTPDRRTG